MLAFLVGTHPSFLSANSLDRLYSTAEEGGSFNRMAFGIEGYSGPAFVILKHEYEDIQEGKKLGTIGALSSTGFQSVLKYYGEADSFIFTCGEKARVLYGFNGKGSTNFVYMNSQKIKGSKYRTGLGFGGDDFTGFRLWIDNEVLTRSTVGFKDQTYPFGSLSEGGNQYLKMRRLEVWGVGGQDALQGIRDVREMEEARLRKARKVNKQELLEGAKGSGLLAKNFSHEQNMVIDMDLIKEE